MPSWVGWYVEPFLVEFFAVAHCSTAPTDPDAKSESRGCALPEGAR